jgi:hypothetical protein
MVIVCAKIGFDWSRVFSRLTPEKRPLPLAAYVAYTTLQSVNALQCDVAAIS